MQIILIRQVKSWYEGCPPDSDQPAKGPLGPFAYPQINAFNALPSRGVNVSIPYQKLFHFLMYSPIFIQAPESNEARLVQRLLDTLTGYDYRTEVVPSLTGARVAAESDMSIGCFLLAIDGPSVSHRLVCATSVGS
jgi:hypothetical protein